MKRIKRGIVTSKSIYGQKTSVTFLLSMSNELSIRPKSTLITVISKQGKGLKKLMHSGSESHLTRKRSGDEVKGVEGHILKKLKTRRRDLMLNFLT